MVLKRVQMGCVLKIITHCPPDMLLVSIWCWLLRSTDAKNGTDVRRIVSPYFRSVIQKTDLWAGERWTVD